MPTIRVLPHPELCPTGTEFSAATGDNLCRVLLSNHIAIEHACEMSKACTTCHVMIRKGFDSLTPPEEDEEDLLDRAWGLTAQSRLSCQVEIAEQDLEVEIPRYTINHARENH
ncbi:MAG: ISC system 2Fe-2S type ferredoxin [Betaproteobacteria bacterium]|nr:ISC system 2Fe-2S type ferredoxin [Betaproteobacteria bacterium]NBT75930.1 ISC system 2Fe-2S type ferredoxin [Betaproteobacteria bacterium]NBY14004.1 ISC system 2Fe-2S type ferredoxin [Betaproteobacteria bacterium]NCA16641.1 ISC system 2Fe-2S type ferredoxin [Betaproteobacteria bacterium]NDF04718.1 ISC system 2Fe-2S type ferredoxin [Betaproteobacteria bacterium]